MIFPVSSKLNNTDLFYSNDITLASKGFRGLNLFGKIKFAKILFTARKKVEAFHKEAIAKKECYIGPFWGELGNFLLHFLPYVSYLKSKGVKVHACYIENCSSFMVDDAGKRLCEEDVLLRNFFAEVRPAGNRVVNPPADILKKLSEFAAKAKTSGFPFLNLSDNDLYWYVFRNWQLNGKQVLYPLEKVFGSANTKNNVVIFPRKKGGAYTPNNGGEWDYMKLAKTLAPFFDTVIFTGRPDMSAEVHEDGNIKLQLSDNNEDILKSCAGARLIVTQHSGAMHIGSYVNVPVLLIFNGKLPVKGLDDSDRFRENIKRKNVYLATSEAEVIDFVKSRAYLV